VDAAVHARAKHDQQVLRRIRLENLEQGWALEASGFEMMNVVVTFACSGVEDL
jgi:hypothetical protein